MQIVLGLPEPRAFSSLPRLRLVQSGIQRVYAQKTTPKTRIRLPITPSILAKIHTHMLPKSSDHDTIMIWAAATTCFFGFFRSGEITLPAGTSFDDTKHLSWGDVAVDNPALPQIIKVKLKVSKSDQLRKGVDVFIGKTGGIICPVAAVLAYMAARGSTNGPFFKFRDGKPLTKARFTGLIREALKAVGLPQEQFAGHSFRIGAATTAAKAGIEDSTIRMMGRWNSAAFLAYIRTPREQLARFSKSLSMSVPSTHTQS